MSQPNSHNTPSPPSTPSKYCNSCGQKNFRPHRSLKELFVEFVEDWLGYDSKIYKTTKTLLVPAKLTIDYFNNNHHKNHYITPIRLFLLLSFIFYLMIQFAGFNLRTLEIKTITDPQTLEQLPQQTVEQSQELSKQSPPAEDTVANENPVIIDDKELCLLENKINLWPQWLENGLKQHVHQWCDLSYLPKDRQQQAQTQMALNLTHNALKILPQTLFLGLPIFALLLSVFYIGKKHLYVEHLVLLMHSHSLLFAAILLYLGWYKLSNAVSWLTYIPLGWAMFIASIIYLFVTQQRYYQLSFAATLWRFIVFTLSYFVLLSFLLFAVILITLANV